MNNENQPSILGITESWLQGHIANAQIQIENYQVMRSDRPYRKGGGCLLYLHNSLVFSEVLTHEDKHCNLISCFVESVNTIIALVYRPPDATPESFDALLLKLQKYIDTIAQNYSMPDTYIMGDFNLPNVNWAHMASNHRSDKSEEILINFAERNFFTQVINKPTRNDNILDLIFTNKPNYVIDVSVTSTTLSDHKLAEITLGYNLTTASTSHRMSDRETIDPFSFRAADYHKADTDCMNAELAEINWCDLWEMCAMHDEDGINFLELLRLIVLQITLKNSPGKKEGGMKRKNPRIQYALKRKRRKLNRKINAIRSKNPASKKLPKLIQEVNAVCYEIQDAIMKHLDHVESRAVENIKVNPRYFYSFAKRRSKTKSTVAPLKDESGQLTNDGTQKSILLSQQYFKAFSDPLKASLPESLSYLNINKDDATYIDGIDINESDIQDAIAELDPYTATPDGDIPAKILISCKEQLSKPLKLFWTNSFQRGTIPHSQKIQYITPIFKKGNRCDAANYRPVSITSHLIKIFERVIRKYLVKYLEENFLLSNKQHGFRKGRSCLTQLLDYVNRIYESLNSGHEFDVVYLDFAKAFDKVDHTILLAKLMKYGVTGKLHQWITAFLYEREQTVVVDGCKSPFQKVISGIPQGTVLGPVLFIIYVNDLLETLDHSSGLCFADDTKLFMPIKSSESATHLQGDLTRSMKWALINNMQLNAQKFEAMNFDLNSSKLLKKLPFSAEFRHYKISEDITLMPVESVRDLGVIISSDRTWTHQIDDVIDSSRIMAAWVLSVFRNRTATVMITTFNSMVRSKLEYCCPVWSPTKIRHIQAPEDIQRQFTRNIVGCRELDYWGRLKRLKIMSLQRRRERYSIIHVWKILHGLAPNDVNMGFYSRNRHGVLATLPPLDHSVQSSVSSGYEATFRIRAAKLWNTLPNEVKCANTLETLKIRLGKHLDTIPDYPPALGYSTPNNNSILEWNRRPHMMQVS